MKRKGLLITLGGLIVVLAGILAAYLLLSKDDETDTKPVEVVELDSIENYGYALEDRDTDLYKERFTQLGEVLKKDDIDYEEYARLLSQLYIIDLYTIANKLNKYDVGSVDFLLDSAKENYILKVEDTIYKYVEDNTYGKRTQELPEVASIEVSEVKETKVKVGDKEYNGFEVNLSWEYKKDLGYDKGAILNLAKIENKLYVIKQSVSRK